MVQSMARVRFVNTGAIRRPFVMGLFFVSAAQFLRGSMLGGHPAAFMEKLPADGTSHATEKPATAGFSGVHNVTIHVRL